MLGFRVQQTLSSEMHAMNEAIHARPHSTTDCSCADAGESRETEDRRGVRSLSDRDDDEEDEDDDGARARVRERGVDAREGF